MKLSVITVTLCLLHSAQGIPYIRLHDIIRENDDVTNSRRIEERHHRHGSTDGRFRPVYHDLFMMDAVWDYDVKKDEPVIIDLTGVDPCDSFSCDDEEICLVQNQNNPVCISRDDISRFSGINSKPYHCVSCPGDDVTSDDVGVCASNGQTFDSRCSMNYYACLSGIKLSYVCDGKCPCPLDLIAQSVEHGMRVYDVTKILGSPRALTVTSLTDDKTSAKVLVQWLPPDGYDTLLGKKAIIDYVIHYSEVNADDWTSLRTPGSMMSLYITGLHSDTDYNFRIQARTSSAIGPLSEKVIHKTIHVTEDKPIDSEDGDIIDDEDVSGDDEEYVN